MTAPEEQGESGETMRTVADLIDFEREYGHKHTGRKEDAIIAVLGLQPANYYRLLNLAIDTTPALEHDPELVGRLCRIRANWERTRAPILRQSRDRATTN